MPEETTTPTAPALCRCGREVKKLNAASDVARCVGCGYMSELCPCETPAD